MKPICMRCHRFFRMKKAGFYFLEGMPERNAAPGNAEPEKWKPYKLWAGDQWECHGCGTTILSGFGNNRIAEHYEDNFSDTVKKLGGDQFQVNDC